MFSELLFKLYLNKKVDKSLVNKTKVFVPNKLDPNPVHWIWPFLVIAISCQKKMQQYIHRA